MGSQTSLKTSQGGGGWIAIPFTLPMDPPLIFENVLNQETREYQKIKGSNSDIK